MSLLPPKTSFRVAPEFQPLLRRLGLSADGVFSDPRVVAWRTLDDRENCTLDATGADGTPVRLHVKRYQPARGFTSPADDEVKGYRSLTFERIPTAPLVGWGKLPDGRSFTIWQDLAGYTPADRLIESGGMTFDQLLAPTADLAARLHARGLHHRDLYLCHFMVRANAAAGDGRRRRPGSGRAADRHRPRPPARRAAHPPAVDHQGPRPVLVQHDQAPGHRRAAHGLAGAICPAARRRHDRRRPARRDRAEGARDRRPRPQPQRRPAEPEHLDPAGRRLARPIRVFRGTVDAPPGAPANAAFRVRKATGDDAEALLAHADRIAGEPGIAITLGPGELNLTVEQERQFVAETNASDNSVFLVAEADRQIIGILTCVGGKRRALRHVTTLGLSVRQEWRGRGVGTALMRAAIEWARGTGVVKRIELHAFARNQAAIRLYERLGFVTEGRRRRAVFRDGEYQDDVIMALLL